MDEGWREAWWIPDESPGGIGAPEVWIDAGTLDNYGGKDPAIVAHVLAGNGGGPWIGALLRFGKYPGADEVVIYMIVARRWDNSANGGRPYYVARSREQEEP